MIAAYLSSKKSLFTATASLLLATSLLISCGGGGGGSSTTTNPVPGTGPQTPPATTTPTGTSTSITPTTLPTTIDSSGTLVTPTPAPTPTTVNTPECAPSAVSWTVGSNSCNATTIGLTDSGAIAAATDGSAPSTGSAFFLCSNGKLATTPLASPAATCVSAASAPIAAADCPETTVSWTVNNATCSATAAQTASGANATATDLTLPSQGSAFFACSNGKLATAALSNPVATCATAAAPPTPPADCADAAVSWTVAGNTCNAIAARTASGANASATDTTVPSTGTAFFSCSNGKLAATPLASPSATCTSAAPAPVDCPAAAVSWTVAGNTCTATVAKAASGANATATDAAMPTTGSALFACTNGTLAASPLAAPAATCTLAAAPVAAECAEAAVSWTVGGNTCNATAAKVASAANASATDSTSPTTGAAFFLCTNGKLATTPLALPAATCTTPLAPPADCVAADVSWSVAGNTCTATAPKAVSGANATANDATAPTTGTAFFACTNGKLSASPLASPSATCVAAAPPPADCPAQNTSWTVAGSTCNAAVAKAASSTNATATDSTAPTTGAAFFSCTNGALAASPLASPAASCVTAAPLPADCPAQDVSWMVAGATCNASVAKVSSGTNAAATDGTAPSLGSAFFACTDGKLAASPVASPAASCVTPAVACAPVARSWTVAGNTCSGTPAAAVASGVNAAVNDATGLATGSASFQCTNGTLSAAPATATCSTPAYDDAKFGILGYTPCTNVGSTTQLKENDTLKLGGVKTDIAFGNGMYQLIVGDTTRSHRFVYLFNQTADIVLSRDKFSRNTLDNYGTGDLSLAYCKKSVDGDNAPVFSAALAKLTSHLNGTSVLTALQIREQHTLMASTMAALVGSEAMLGQAFKLIDLYDAKRGALFTLGAKSGRGFENVPVRDKPTSDDAIDNFSIDRAIFALLQAIFEDVYTKPDVYVKYELFLEGKKFLTSNSFPGAVKNQAISANFKTQINASVPKYFGVTPRFANVDARRPTGYFLQAGDTGSVDVPSSLVNKGYKILVGAHTSDKSAVEHTFRPYLMHMEFPITATKTKIYNPFGGGVYLIVPLGSADGLVTLGINNVVASPFFSNTSHRKTTPAEWDIQRKNPGPMADFETDKFMLQVPTSFIFNYPNPSLLMAEWDARIDAISSSHGQPPVSGNVKMFKQIDVYRDHDFYGAAGYPMSTDQYETYYDSTRTGNENAWYLRTGPNFLNQDGTATGGKEFWATVDFHEYGHTLHVSMFSEYTEYESIVNFPAVALYAKAVGQDIDTAFGNSHPGLLGGKPPTRILAAVDWMVTQKFRDGKTMIADEMSYQFRGHAKYVDIVALFGWDSIGKFFKEEQDRAVFLKVERRPQFDDGFSQYYYGANNGQGTDSRIFRLSKAAGVDLRPLLHFWGVQPIDNGELAKRLIAEGLVPSRKIYERIELYRDNILSGTASYKDWHDLPVDWNATFAQQTKDYINNNILSNTGNNYFPSGRPLTNN